MLRRIYISSAATKRMVEFSVDAATDTTNFIGSTIGSEIVVQFLFTNSQESVSFLNLVTSVKRQLCRVTYTCTCRKNGDRNL